MINILLNGCSGKMGRVISEVSSKFSDLTIAAGVDKFPSSNANYPVFKNITDCNVNFDVILDFSRPDSLSDLLNYAKDKNLPIVICTTGFSKEQINEINDASKVIPVFRSANMSIGINVINNVLKNISALLYEDFDIELIEKHHNQKVDAPSGTALLLADTIKESLPEETVYVHGRDGIAKRKHNEIGIHAVRGGSIVGEHDVIFAGQGETIEIKHTAISRDVFAIGALKASKYLFGKTAGLYNMDNVINDK